MGLGRYLQFRLCRSGGDCHIYMITCTPRFGVTFRANHGDDFAIQGLSVELTYLHHCAFAIEVFQACLRVLPKQ